MARNEEATLWLKIKTAGQDALDRFRITLGDIINIAKNLANALAAPIRAYQEQEEAVNALTQAMVNNGIYSRELKDSYLKQADALQKVTLFGDEQIIAAQAAAQQQIGNIQITKDLTSAILDFATAQKMDAASAAELVGKAIGTSTNALGRYGVEINSALSPTQKMAQAIEGLNNKFGGQAEAATGGLGALKMLNKVVGELIEDLGGRLAPVIVYFSKALKSIADDTSTTTPIIDGLVRSLQVLTNIGVVLGGVFEYFGKIIGVYVGGAIGTVAQLLEGKFKQAMETAKTTFSGGGAVLVDVMKNTNDRLLAVNDAFNQEKAAKDAEEEKKLKESLIRKGEIAAQAATEQRIKELEMQAANQEADLATLNMTEEEKLAWMAQWYDQQIALAQSAADRKTLLEEQAAIRDEQLAAARAKQREILEQKSAQARVNIMQGAANLITAVSDEGSKAAFIAQKVAAIAGSIVATNLAAAQALAVPPAPNIPLANMAMVAGGLNTAAIAATAIKGLAEGGIVKARPGGGIYQIGEGGQDEAVIPLDRAGEFGLGGGGTHIHFHGPVLGDPAQAREFAIVVDRQLLELRRNNESLSFDERVV